MGNGLENQPIVFMEWVPNLRKMMNYTERNIEFELNLTLGGI